MRILKKKVVVGALAFVLLFAAIFLFGALILSNAPTNSDAHAPDFSLTDLDGNTFSLSDFMGKVVIIDFMATWCGPCRQQMSHYKVVWETYFDKIVLMSIDVDPRESENMLRAFAQQFTYATWIWARDTANLAEAYKVTAIPKTVIIDQDGYVTFTHVGVVDASVLIQEIDQLIA